MCLGAQESKSDTLEQVVVRAKTISFNATINPSQILHSDELNRTNSLTVSDAVKYLSGVQLKDYGGIGGLKTINVRSLGSIHTAILYDGMQLGNAQNGQVDLGKFSLDNIESIELAIGQAANQLQPAHAYAASSVLFVRSKVPVFRSGEVNHFRAAFKTGSFGLLNPSVLWHHKLNEKLKSSFSSELVKANGQYKFRFQNGALDTLLTRKNGDVGALRIEAGLYRTTADSSSQWNLKMYSYTSARGLPAVISLENSVSVQRFSDNDFFVQSSFKKSFNPKHQLLLNAKYAYNFNNYLDPFHPGDGGLNNRFKQTEFYFSAANGYNISDLLSFHLSADLIRSAMQANLQNFANPIRTVGLIALSSTIKNQHLTIQGNLLASLSAEQVLNGTSVAANKQVFSPSVFARWKPFEQSEFQLTGFYKNIFRLPTFNDQYYTMSGNSDLKPEYTNQYNIGFSYTKAIAMLDYVSVQGNVYHNEISNKIIATPKGGIFWSMENIGKVQVRGAEVNIKSEIQLKSDMDVSFRLNYTLQQAMDRTEGNFFGKEVPYSPQHSGNAGISLSRKAMMLNYNFIYTGEHFNLRANAAGDYAQPWYTHDVSAGFYKRYNRSKWKLLAEVNNVMNLHYDVIRNYPMPGRNYRISLTFYY